MYTQHTFGNDPIAVALSRFILPTLMFYVCMCVHSFWSLENVLASKKLSLPKIVTKDQFQHVIINLLSFVKQV